MADQDFNIKVVTTADTAGLRQTTAEMDKLREKQAQQASQAGVEIGTVLGQLIGRLAGIGVIYEGLNNVRQVTSEINRNSAESDKEWASLVSHFREAAVAARGITSEGDALKIAGNALKDIDTIQTRIKAATQEEVGITGKWVDTFGHLVELVKSFGTASEEEGRINDNIIKERLADLQVQAAVAHQNAVKEIENNEKILSQFREMENIPFRDAFDDINTQLEEARAKQAAWNADGKRNVQQYYEAGQQVQNLLRILNALEANENRRAASAKEAARAAREEESFLGGAAKTSMPQVRAALEQEDAARRARAAGDERAADQFTKSSEAFQRAMSPGQRDEFSQLKAAMDKMNVSLQMILEQFR